MYWVAPMRDATTGRRYRANGTCRAWYPAGGDAPQAKPDVTDPATVALMIEQTTGHTIEEIGAAILAADGEKCPA